MPFRTCRNACRALARYVLRRGFCTGSSFGFRNCGRPAGQHRAPRVPALGVFVVPRATKGIASAGPRGESPLPRCVGHRRPPSSSQNSGAFASMPRTVFSTRNGSVARRKRLSYPWPGGMGDAESGDSPGIPPDARSSWILAVEGHVYLNLWSSRVLRISGPLGFGLSQGRKPPPFLGCFDFPAVNSKKNP